MDPLQLSCFANPLRLRLLLACALEERTLSQLQRQLDVSMSKLHFHASKLLGAKLLHVSRSQARAGRAMKFYRAVAVSFLVAQDSLDMLPGDRWSAQLRQALRNEQIRTGGTSILYSAAPSGKILAKVQKHGSAVPARSVELWKIMRLNAQQHASLASQLGELLERFTRLDPGTSADEYLVHAAFAPRD